MSKTRSSPDDRPDNPARFQKGDSGNDFYCHIVRNITGRYLFCIYYGGKLVIYFIKRQLKEKALF